MVLSCDMLQWRVDRIAKYKVTYPSNAEKTAVQEEEDVAAIKAAGTLTSSGSKAESTGTDCWSITSAGSPTVVACISELVV